MAVMPDERLKFIVNPVQDNMFFKKLKEKKKYERKKENEEGEEDK
ncbi:hypothetical protein DOY81_002482 [Sarcophaga bullata]|nr:hypothetical protein DOY81_002482 [Sarcophaga bullata]